MAIWERIDGTATEYERYQEKEWRLKKVALALYETCKGAKLSVGEVKTVCQKLEKMANQSHLS